MIDTEREEALKLLDAARHQVESIIEMLNDRNCDVDICKRLMAIPVLLDMTTSIILHSHIRDCLGSASENSLGENLDDVFKLVDRYSR